LKQTGAFVTFIATLGCCIAYYVTFKTYHLHLQKADSLKAILENPNARVASGAQGKRVMKRLGMAAPEKKQVAEKKTESTSVEEHADEISALIAKAKIAQSLGSTPQS